MEKAVWGIEIYYTSPLTLKVHLKSLNFIHLKKIENNVLPSIFLVKRMCQ